VLVSFREAVALELRVALSRNAQPVWFRVVKWTLIITAFVSYREAPNFWWWFAGVACLAVGVHLLWRTKTRRWTRPWGGWNDVAATRPIIEEDRSR
jgi:hypothetical protein